MMKARWNNLFIFVKNGRWQTLEGVLSEKHGAYEAMCEIAPVYDIDPKTIGVVNVYVNSSNVKSIPLSESNEYLHFLD